MISFDAIFPLFEGNSINYYIGEDEIIQTFSLQLKVASFQLYLE